MAERTCYVGPAQYTCLNPMYPYRDPKRWLWLSSLVVPAVNGAGPGLYLATGVAGLVWLPVALFWVLVPLVDWWLGEDRNNPPEEAVPDLEADPYYRYITYAVVPVLWVTFAFAAWFYVRHPLAWYHAPALILITGSVGGFCINVGHELGHKRSALERWLARIVLAPTCYGHFYIEHNRGHHRDVATPEDPASSRMGESIWRFVLREMPGAFVRAWKLERERLGGWFTPRNEILAPLLLTVMFWTGLTLWLGIRVLPFVVLSSLWANFQLTSANYVEHYGLLRRKLPNGRYEICRPHHSWNSNHLFSNLALFHLQRHSDHHAHPARRYQSLRHFEDLPQLPNGYFGMFLASWVPPLWYRIMDRRLLAAVGSDPSRINFDPRQRERLLTKYWAGASVH